MRLVVVGICAAVILFSATALSQSDENSGVDWQRGPTIAKLGSQAQLTVPRGFLFTGMAGARKFLELTKNIPSGQELGVLAPEKGGWFAIFEFADVGYVKDDEKASLDVDAMLDSIRKATEASNEERKRRGWGRVTVLDWTQPPHYDESTHNLEWALRLKDEEDRTNSNLNTRYLGRRGYISVTLVGGLDNPTDNFQTATATFRRVLTGFSYTPDNDYRAFVKGDKVAEYGLTALVLGGAAAVAAKTGFFKLIWKLLLVGWKLILAGLAALGGLLKKIFGGRRRPPEVEIPASNGQ